MRWVWRTQEDINFRPKARVALRPKFPAVGFDDRTRDRKPNAHTVLLCGDESVENAIYKVNGQPTSIIDEFSKHLTILGSPGPNAQQRQSLCALHCFHGVSYQINNHLLNLETIYECHENRVLLIILD